MSVKVGDVCSFLNAYAPLDLQESYDNAGLILGNATTEVTGVLVALDVTEAVVAEAVVKGCNLIVSHHPIIFKGIKCITGRNYVERTIIDAVKNDVAIYASHTNLDSVKGGVNQVISHKLGLVDTAFLLSKTNYLVKITVFIPREHLNSVREVMFSVGAGRLGNYDSCSFKADGKGTFRALEGADPYVGRIGDVHSESEAKLEVVVTRSLLSNVLDAMLKAHPYEEVAYDVVSLDNLCADVGSGMIGRLLEPMPKVEFLKKIKSVFKAGIVRHTDGNRNDMITKVAVCGGSGSFLLAQAKRQGADVFVSSDFKYHEFFDAENQIMIADIGHYESEQFTKNLLHDILKEKFSNFATHLSLINTNPIKYL